MMRNKKRIGGVLAAFLLTLAAVCGVYTPAFAASETTVTYTFSGSEAAKAGFAEGTVTITSASGTASGGYYLLYFANQSGLLTGYDEFASIPVTGSTVTYVVKEGTLLPVGATEIAVFKSSSAFLDTPPSYAQRIATVALPSTKQLTLGTPSFSFGAVSDVHMTYETLGYGAHQKWVNVLNFFASQGMEKVIVTGDMTGDEYNQPLTEQYATYRQLVASSNMAYENIYECIGNHGNTEVGRTQFVQYTGGADEVHPFENSAWFSVMLKGKTAADRDNLFLFMAQEMSSPGTSAQFDNFSKEQIDWLEGMLKTYANTDTNIYLIEHSPFLNYGPGDRHPGDYTTMIQFNDAYPQTMRLKGLLETYKNIIHLSGHTHLSLYDNENYSTENGTSCRMVHVPSGCQPATYNNATQTLGSGDGRHTVNASYGSEAYTVRVYDDCIVFTGYNVTTGKIIPAASYILPTEVTQTADEAFAGSGTIDDPYLIQTAADFRALTNGFNASTSATQSEMYGYGQYFLQTADIDMTDVAGYAGTTATGSTKAYFAGVYNGGGHTLTVKIDAAGMRSIFPYTYGTITNVHFKGSIRAVDGAQPIRSLYGNAINCLVDMQLSATCANGLLYSNYSYSYNIYTSGIFGGNKPDAFAVSDYSDKVYNFYHWCVTESGAAVTDERGTRTNDTAAIVAAMNDRESDAYRAAQAVLGGVQMETVAVSNGNIVFAQSLCEIGDVDMNGAVTTVDARLLIKDLLRTESAFTAAQMRLADVDGNGCLTTSDARDLLRKVLK